MIDTPKVLQTKPQDAAVIHITVPRADIQKVMGPGIAELRQTLEAQGIAPTGPWFTHHRRRPTDTFDFAACVAVASPVAAAGRVQTGRFPAARVARTVYHGPYEGLGGAWGELCDWIEANGHVPREDLWECYVVGPESSHDPAAWRTELNRPLIS